METTRNRTKREVVASLKAYALRMEEWVHPVDAVKKLRPSAANSFLLGVMFDRNIDADKAWEAGDWINDSLGDQDDPSMLWSSLVTMEKKQLIGFLRYGYGGKAFHRYYKTFANQLPKAAKYILEKYQGDPRRIWNSKRDISRVRESLEAIPGIGQALSRMAVLILARNYGLLGGKSALPQLDIKTDAQLMRVFTRSGLIPERGRSRDAIEVARKLAPRFPAILDGPAWEIGRKWCHPKKPDCKNCPIIKACPTILS
jgi:endonuclease-3